MNKIADRLHPRPSAANAAEIRPSEIREQLGLAISARPKERERVRRKIRHRHDLSIRIDLILASIGAKNALETERRYASRCRQSPYDVSAFIDKAFGRHDWREFELRFLGHAAPSIGVDIHHSQDGRRRLHEIERDIEAVTD
jgi:hypothetical protein